MTYRFLMTYEDGSTKNVDANSRQDAIINNDPERVVGCEYVPDNFFEKEK